MAITAIKKRKFSFVEKGTTIDLPDPGVNYSPKEVLDFYSFQYPKLLNGQMKEPEINEEANEIIYSIDTKPAGKA